MLYHSPADIVRKLLVDIGQGTDAQLGGAWPVFATGEPDMPDSAITVYDTSGIDFGTLQPSGELAEIFGVQIRIRAAAQSPGYAKAAAIASAIDTQVYDNAVTIGTRTYRVQAFKRTSGVLGLGKEPGNKRRLFTVNALVNITLE